MTGMCLDCRNGRPDRCDLAPYPCGTTWGAGYIEPAPTKPLTLFGPLHAS